MATRALLDALQDPALYAHPVTGFELLETHISWVLLTGPYAYKLKKPVDLGFLDFSTLAQRHHFCAEELRLNRRLAPRLYRDVVAIHGTEAAPNLRGAGPLLEYAVQMVQFPQQALLDRVLARGELTAAHVDALAAAVAAFHADAPVSGPDRPYGEPDLVFQPVRENFVQIDPLLDDPAERARLSRLRDWSVNRFHELREALLRRKAGGRVRECHGDLHLGNLLLDGDGVSAFDCLEFSPPLRWIDVASDLAFLLMDLAEHGADAFAARLLDGYLARSGDYGLLAVLPFYLVYRALVRAKVAAIRLGQGGADAGELHAYLALAERLRRPPAPCLLATHGLSGSGKTHVTQALLERLGAVRLRSDVERKRLLGRDAASSTSEAARDAVYGAEMGARTYARLGELAREVLEAGYPVIVDATCLKRAQRDGFARLAQQARVPFALLDLDTQEHVLAQRIAGRLAAGGDASEADLEVLALQQREREPLAADERGYTVTLDGAAPDLQAALAALLERGIGA